MTVVLYTIGTALCLLGGLLALISMAVMWSDDTDSSAGAGSAFAIILAFLLLMSGSAMFQYTP